MKKYPYLILALPLASLISSSAHATLIAHWDFNEGSGSTAIDSAGSNNATLVGDPTWVIDSFTGSALEFDGSGDAVQASVAGLPTGSAERTISMWINANTTALDQKFFSYGSTSGSGTAFSWTLEDSGGAPTVFFRHNGGNRQFTGTSVTLGTWTHVGIVVPTGASAANDVLLYLNGSLVTGTTNSVTLNTGSSDVVIGGKGTVFSAGLAEFDGMIDRVQIYDNALTSGEIATLAAVPEPSAVFLLLGCFTTLFAMRRRYRPAA